jgi:hypothetical protein
MRALIVSVVAIATAATAMAEETKPGLPQFLADALASHNMRSVLTDIRIEEDGHLITRQFRNSVIRNTTWLYRPKSDELSYLLNDIFSHVTESTQTTFAVEQKEGVLEQSDPKKLAKLKFEAIGDKRIKTTFRIPYTTPHRCGQEDHNVVLSGVIDFNEKHAATEAVSPELLAMMERDGLHYIFNQAEDDLYCAQIEAEKSAKADAEKSQDKAVTAPKADDTGKAKAE